MNRLHYKNLDFLLTDVPGVLRFLDEVDNSKDGREKYQARQSSRGYETAAVTYLPLARTDDPHDRVVVKSQYNKWLTLSAQTSANSWTSQRLQWFNMGNCCT